MAAQFDDQGDGAFRRRRPRPVTDFGSSVVHWMSKRLPAYKGTSQYEQERPSLSYVFDMLPPSARLNNPAEYIPTRFLHQSLGKSKKPVTVVRWMPDGRRLLAGVHNGEFMLWNGMSFNFETVTAMGSSSIRAAEWSNKKDWLISANDEGTIFYLQPTLNNPHQFKGHDAPIRDLAFSPTDSKFVTASDDNTLKIWDFVSSANESTFSDHGWDVKACDWHPTKGLVVSGSKDHSVKLWDPRTTRNLTTLHGHKNAITATLFSRIRDQLLATAGRDSQVRIFDLRMMRDVVVLRGHEKGVTTVAWHPIHPSLISTGGEDGALHTYLLSEPNIPTGISATSVSPYSTPDPKSAPAQSIYPAHKIPYAHDSAAWSLDWHPLGHILASGSNDHYTRFWSRSQPGQIEPFKDRYHLGEEGAEAQGTYDKKMSNRQAREQEEQEEEDEAEGLEDQNNADGNAMAIPGLPGLQSLPGLGSLLSSGVGAIPPSQTNGAPQPPMFQIPGMAPNSNMQMHMNMNMNQGSSFSMGIPSSNLPPPPHLQHQQPQQHIPRMAPGMDPAALQRLIYAQQQQPPQPQSNTGYPPPLHLAGNVLSNGMQSYQPQSSVPFSQAAQYPGNGIPGLVGSDSFPSGGLPGLAGMPINNTNDALAAAAAAAARRRAPLPSQQEGFKAEQARGNFRVAR